MKIDWRLVSHVGAAIVGTVVPGVEKAEQLAWQLGNLQGKAKQDSVVALVQSALTASNSFMERQLATDADVERATRSVIDAVVALQTIIAKKTAVGAGT